MGPCVRRDDRELWRDGTLYKRARRGTEKIPTCVRGDDKVATTYPSSTASAPVTASALSVTVFSSEVACTLMFSAKKRASVT